MNMLQLNDLLHPSDWECYWTFFGNDHEGLPKEATYVIFEYYCVNTKCDCQSIKAEIKQLGKDGEPLNKTLAVIDYNWSSEKNKCQPSLNKQSPKTDLALKLFEIYKEFIHCEEYLIRIKAQYTKVKNLSSEKALGITSANKNIGRNAKCPCGSNKKYKQCCIYK
jgi:uncharacterized protein YchJ